MATIIENNDANPNRPVLVNQDSGAGWAVAVLIIVVVLIAGAFWYMRYYRPASVAPGATVQVNLPASGYAPATTNTAPATQPSTAPAAPNSNTTQ